MDCIFCKIANKEIETNLIYEDEYVVAFNDLNPQAKIHVLVVPKIHIESINELNENNMFVIQKLFEVVKKVTKKLELSDKGFRTIINTGSEAGQTVKHLHIHILGGEKLTEKMA